MSSQMKNLGKLSLCILLCLSVGIIGSIFDQASMKSWYSTLDQPAWAPPIHYLSPIWATTYVLMGISLWMAINAKAPKEVYALFILLLLLNLVSAFVFFGMHSVFLGLVVLLLLDIIVITTISELWSISKWASVTLSPFMLWLLFVTYLNFSLFMLNRDFAYF